VMGDPAIKGSVMVNLVTDLLQMRNEGRISGEELTARLAPEDRVILEQDVLPSTWYPIESYRRMTELLLEKEGGGEDYLRARGAGSAQRILDGGLYTEMRRLRPGARERTFNAVERSVRSLVALSQTILNFGRGEVLPDPDHPRRLVIQISDAAAYPEVLRFTSEGFYNACVRAVGSGFSWRSSRPQRDCIVMQMDADFDA
jgi:hypothetical protein